ncbi:MAG: glycosyltransferase [Phycisphaerales bacterium]|jgi:glycosyltransferase involved in cell wall biosynthesis|nr:glycosyltransferase [Phycisphaerales bacterium]
MKILHYCSRIRLEDGGVVRAVLDLTTSLAKSGKSVTLMATEGEDLPKKETGVQTILTGSFDRAPIRFSTNRLNSIKDHIQQSDVLHLHTPWEPANVQLAKIARSCDIPYVVSVHGMLDDWCMEQKGLKKRIYLQLSGRKFLQKAHAIHCTAEAEVTQVKRWTPRGKHVVIPLVFDPSEYLDPPPTSDPDKYWPTREENLPIVLFLSRIHEKKGIEKLLRAASAINTTHKARFVIAGCGEPEYEKSLQKLSNDLGIDQHVNFVGFVEGDRKTSLLRSADIFALPTSQENFGLVFPEAMACGVPVITTKGVDIWPELEKSGGAIITDGSVDQITSSIIQLLDEISIRTKMGDAGKKWVEETFAGETVVNRYIDLYRKIINQ